MTLATPSDSPRLAAARAGLAAARTARAVGPRPTAEGLRVAYLELLKLSLCDLTGSTTTSVGRTPDGLVMSRELADDQLQVRAAGMDWPLQGLTMVGLKRLDDLQACVESVVDDGIEGDLIEAGVWRGGASILMRATLDSLGHQQRTVWVADSFRGFPAAEIAQEDDLAVFDFLAVPLAEVRENFARLGLDDGVHFVPGFFADTMSSLGQHRWALVRLDADTYDTTRLALRSLYPRLAAGGYMIIDDYGALQECQQAVDDFRREHHITEPLEEVDWTAVRWRRHSDAPPAGLDPVCALTDPGPAPRAVERGSRAHVPSVAELELGETVSALRARLAVAEAQARGREDRSLRAAKRWLLQRLGRRHQGPTR